MNNQKEAKCTCKEISYLGAKGFHRDVNCPIHNIKEEKAIELLRKLRSFHNNSTTTDLVYRSPAFELRLEADRIEYRESLLAEIDEFLALNS